MLSRSGCSCLYTSMALFFLQQPLLLLCGSNIKAFMHVTVYCWSWILTRYFENEHVLNSWISNSFMRTPTSCTQNIRVGLMMTQPGTTASIRQARWVSASHIWPLQNCKGKKKCWVTYTQYVPGLKSNGHDGMVSGCVYQEWAKIHWFFFAIVGNCWSLLKTGTFNTCYRWSVHANDLSNTISWLVISLSVRPSQQ